MQATSPPPIFLPGSSISIPMPAPSPAPDSTIGSEGLATMLLVSAQDDRRVHQGRLLWGLAGLTMLGGLPPLALRLVGQLPSTTGNVLADLFQPLRLPIAAALTLTFALPGLLVLLSMLEGQPRPNAVTQAISRAYFRLGLLAFGITPALTLYALTGASAGWIQGTTLLTYFGAGGFALAHFLRELCDAMQQRTPAIVALILGWGGFVCVLSVYFVIKLVFV